MDIKRGITRPTTL